VSALLAPVSRIASIPAKRKRVIEVRFQEGQRYLHQLDNGRPGIWRAELRPDHWSHKVQYSAEALHRNEAIRKLLVLLGQVEYSTWLPDYIVT
jgi:hypothetical protein